MKRLTALMLTVLLLTGCVTAALAASSRATYPGADEIIALFNGVTLQKDDGSGDYIVATMNNDAPTVRFYYGSQDTRCDLADDTNPVVTKDGNNILITAGAGKITVSFTAYVQNGKLVGMRVNISGTMGMDQLSGLYGKDPTPKPAPKPVPATGDDANLALYAALMLGAAAVIVVSRKKRSCR